jgi:hypothetical protein
LEIVNSGEAKVSQFDVAIMRDKQIMRLEVAMDNPMAVQEVNTRKDLEKNVLEQKKI